MYREIIDACKICTFKTPGEPQVILLLHTFSSSISFHSPFLDTVFSFLASFSFPSHPPSGMDRL